MLKKGIITLVVIISLVDFIVAQTDSQGKNIVYTKENDMGLTIGSNGLGLMYRIGTIEDIYKSWFWEFELLEMKHPTEYKQKNEDISGAKSFAYGKQNSLYVLRIGRIHSDLIFRKAEMNGVRVSYTYGGGISIGVLKSYYLNVLYPTIYPGYYEVITERYNPDQPIEDQEFMNWYAIYGSAGFKYGITELDVLPGIYAKAGLQFEFGEYLDVVKAIEVGASLDAYPKRVPIMIKEENRFLFLSLYISLQIGSRKVH